MARVFYLCAVFEFVVDGLDKGSFSQKYSVIHRSQSAIVVAYQMQPESVKPAQRAFAALRYSLEHLVHVYPLVAAHA